MGWVHPIDYYPTDWRPVFDWNSVIILSGLVYVGFDARFMQLACNDLRSAVQFRPAHRY